MPERPQLEIKVVCRPGHVGIEVNDKLGIHHYCRNSYLTRTESIPTHGHPSNIEGIENAKMSTKVTKVTKIKSTLVFLIEPITQSERTHMKIKIAWFYSFRYDDY